MVSDLPYHLCMCEEQHWPATIPTPTQHCGCCPMSCWIPGPCPYMDTGFPWGGMGDEFPILYSIYPPGHHAATANDNNTCQIPAPGPSIRVVPALYHMGGFVPGGWVRRLESHPVCLCGGGEAVHICPHKPDKQHTTADDCIYNTLVWVARHTSMRPHTTKHGHPQAHQCP